MTERVISAVQSHVTCVTAQFIVLYLLFALCFPMFRLRIPVQKLKARASFGLRLLHRWAVRSPAEASNGAHGHSHHQGARGRKVSHSNGGRASSSSPKDPWHWRDRRHGPPIHWYPSLCTTRQRRIALGCMPSSCATTIQVALCCACNLILLTKP